MANFAVIENNKVINVIVADSKEIAEEVTQKTCIEYTLEDNVDLNDNYIDGVFSKPAEETL